MNSTPATFATSAVEHSVCVGDAASSATAASSRSRAV